MAVADRGEDVAPPSVRVALIGLGAIGREVCKALVGRTSARVVAAADPAFAGRDAGEVAGLPANGVVVAARVEDALVAGAAAAGVDVVSSCEDLACADWATPELARRIDAAALQGGITVLGTGVNPGFVMDRLPLQLAGACVRVTRIHVQRVVDAAKRRGPLRAKVGADLTPAQFREGVASRKLGHRGLPESCALIGRGLGTPFDEVRTTIDPVVASAANPRA